MSAAATAAGYLYASGRLRGRTARDQETHQEPQQPKRSAPEPRLVRVAVLEEAQEKPRRTPKIEYRVRRRWSAE